jgi:hypothetical protein
MKTNPEYPPQVQRALDLLEVHYNSFHGVVDLARETGHPVPLDTRAWSQMLVSVLCDIKGLERKKGTDLADGSDVKGASTWEAIDTPRFNSVIKAGTLSNTSGKIESLDSMPFLFLVLWDTAPGSGNHRCRIWCVRPQKDKLFRKICATWYRQREDGIIKSDNFQLHPPRNKNSNVIRNTCGNLEYPLLFCAERIAGTYQVVSYSPDVMQHGTCHATSSP